MIDSASNLLVNSLNSKHKNIKVRQGNSTETLQTDKNGFFKIAKNLNDTLFINVNPESEFFGANFKIEPNKIKDTLRLYMSSIKYEIHRDSIISPIFFNEYNENQALSDYNKNIKQILIPIMGWQSSEYHEKIKELSTKYNLKLKYIYDPNVFELRIISRYNKVIQNLIGINENVW